MIAYARNVVICILRTKAIIARALQGLVVCFEDFCFEELPFKENINEQLSIPDVSTATGNIVYIFGEQTRENVTIYQTFWLIPKHKRLTTMTHK